MRFAGFRVYECESIRDLRQQLMVSTTVEAVIMVEDIVSIPPEAITAAKSYFPGPLVLFEGRYPDGYETSFDQRIPNLTSPSDWLPQIQAAIENYDEYSRAERSREWI